MLIDAEILDEDVRSEQYQGANVVAGSSMDQSDGGAIAVADENGILNVQLGKKIRQRVEPFVVHIGDGAGFGEEIGVARTIARINSDRDNPWSRRRVRGSLSSAR